MPLILNIDTSTQHGSTCIARDGNCIAILQNPEQKDHAAWIHPAIKNLLKQANCTLTDLQAVAVTAGPGSYTGLRVAMSTAKGLCYALKIPMITENTLRVMAFVSVEHWNGLHHSTDSLHCPMIDARRMEVFTALYNSSLTEIMQPAALVLTHHSFMKELETNTIVFSGIGSEKFRPLMNHPHAIFEDFQFNATHLAMLSNMKFLSGEFVDVAYAEPLYLKEFYTVPKK